MAETKKFHSLTVQMMLVIGIAAALALLVGICGYIGGRMAVEKFYLSETAATRRMTEEAASFRTYVAENNLASTDVNGVEQWNRDHPYTQLTIKGLETTISSNVNGAELMGTESGLLLQSGQVASGGMEFSVNFRDGAYSVVVYESSQTLFNEAVKVSAIVLGSVVFLLVVLQYDQRLTRSVQTLSRQVRQVSRGDLDMQILPQSHDEIGQLALDVDTMRLSIIDQLQKEEAAWQANSQLITAISHDVRTPLTALMGYLEILSDESLTPEERQSYLDICKNNAQRLKGLTDELFGFFLVFGKPKPDQKLEKYDAATLLDQILLEQEMRLGQEGFDVRPVQQGEPEGMLCVDVGHLRRVFDNLFSNVSKYADPQRPVCILREVEQRRLHVTISNYIPAQAKPVESNRIGLQTCKKLLDAMGGEFVQGKTQDSFTAEVILPLYEK